MRDFNNGGDITVGGDFNIIDHSQNEFIPLTHCTSQHLKERELPFRLENLKREFWAKVSRLKYIFLLAAALFAGSAIWAQLNGQKDLASIFMQLGSLIVAAMGVKGVFEPNEFERRERAAVHEIRMILRSRRDE
ncbi:hypothetical protein [Paludibacterium yongneupense]|uniref:hypothetical protein n=1 Tax=Paludibacterium yongneupense TaxID=400061 RepID=UPI0003F543E7|nr:hypothetical protein [Paludibacterium yongneupense]